MLTLTNRNLSLSHYYFNYVIIANVCFFLFLQPLQSHRETLEWEADTTWNRTPSVSMLSFVVFHFNESINKPLWSYIDADYLLTSRRGCVFSFCPSVYCNQMSVFPLKTGFFLFDFLPGFICPAQFDTAPAKNKTKCEFQGQQIRELESGTVQGCSPPAGLSCGGPAITKGSAATPLDAVVKEVACRNLFCTIMCCVVNLCPCFWMTEPFNDASFIPYHDNSARSQRPLLPVEHSK